MTENLGGKTSLNESVVVAAEIISLKKFSSFVQNIVPIDSAEKAGQYREAAFLHYGELKSAQKLKKN